VRRRRGAHALATWGAQSAPQSPHERLGAPRRSRGSPRDTPRGS
jgi:hypothetical protein